MNNQEKWFAKSFRRNLVDMHIEGWDPTFLSEFDPEKYLQLLLRSNVQTAMIYLNSHVGYCYWPSLSGEMHPGFNGESRMEPLFKGCRDHGLSTVAYYTLIYNNWVYDKHPQWRMIDLKGLGSRDRRVSKDPGVGDGDSGNRYGLCCPNNDDYRAFTATQIKEFCARFDFDGIFFDMCFWPLVCYCDSCRDRYQRETGKEIPEVIDWHNEEWLTFQAKRIDWLADFAQFASEEAKRNKPGVTVEHQGSTLFGGTWMRGVSDNFIKANDYIGGDLYGGQKQQSLACKVYHTMTPNHPFEYMTSRCDPNLYNHTTTKQHELLRLQNGITLAHHGAFLVIDAIDPIGTMNESFYDALGEVFEESKYFESYLTGELCADVGLYFSHNAKPDSDVNGMSTNMPNFDKPHLAALLGAAEHLSSAHIPHAVVLKGSDLSYYKVVVVPEAKILDDEEVEAIEKYVQKGGNLYLSGHTYPPLLERLLGVTCKGMTDETVTYISPVNSTSPLLPGMSSKYPATIFAAMPILSGAKTDEVLATITLPGTLPDDPTHFVSIHSNPPVRETTYPSIIRKKFGDGNVIWVAAPIETGKQNVYLLSFLSLIKSFMKSAPAFKINGHPSTEAILFKDIDRSRFCISLVNIQDNLPLIPVMNTKVFVNMERHQPISVTDVRNGEKVSYRVEDGYLEFEIEKLEVFEMYEIRFMGTENEA